MQMTRSVQVCFRDTQNVCDLKVYIHDLDIYFGYFPNNYFLGFLY